MDYPKGTKFNDWLLYPEPQNGKTVFVIRRWVLFPKDHDPKKKLERLPINKYRQWRDNPAELQKLVIRLNEQVKQGEKTRQLIAIRHAFISQDFLDSYREQLLIQIPTKDKAQAEYYFLLTYFLNFFINKLNMPDPLQWHLHQKDKWAKYLLSDEVPKAASTKKDIIRAANRFMIYLHEHRPTEVPPLKFSPITKAMFKVIEANRSLAGQMREANFIGPEEWAVIQMKLPQKIAPFVLLAYNYGLRRAETLGLELKDVRKDFLSVERQLLAVPNKMPQYGLLKGREKRMVRHAWFADAKSAYGWITKAQANLIHPDSLSDEWDRFMKNLKMKFRFHDLRHTWTTRSVRIKGVTLNDVRLAAGHQNIETTQRYLHDDRELDDDVYVPEASEGMARKSG